MTDEELRAIEAKAHAARERFSMNPPRYVAGEDVDSVLAQDVPRLVAEVRRLHAGIASIRAELSAPHWSPEERKAFGLALKWLGEEEPHA